MDYGTDLSVITEAFRQGYAAADAVQQTMHAPMSSAVPLNPGDDPDSSPWVPEPLGDGGGVT